MRKWCKDKQFFDESMKERITLTRKEVEGKESQDIWKAFQPKFMVVSDVAKYSRFFKTLLETALRECIRQNVFVVELRHTLGSLFDDRKTLFGGEDKK